ncbi:MAG: hypothetical protein CMF72_08930 [Mameliella sp.]|nr:hypothetical protein [Mameliella sp.]
MTWIMLILILTGTTKVTRIEAQQMNKEKGVDWDEKRWKQHWAGLRKSQKKMKKKFMWLVLKV